MNEVNTEGLQLVVDDLDKAEAAAKLLDKGTKKLILKLTGEVRRWRSLGKDLVHGAMLAALPAEKADLEARYAEAVNRAVTLEERRASEEVCIENTLLHEEVARLKKENAVLRGSR